MLTGRIGATLVALATFLFFSLLTTSATALPLVGIDDGQTYELHDHPDGGAAPPYYGFRLDGLYGGGPSEVNTFSFDTDAASMLLTYEDDTLTIEGVMYENLTGDLWDVQMTYVMSPTLEDGNLASTGPEGSNTGWMTNLTTNMFVTLEDFMPTTFFLGSNHRDFAGISGWGWVNHSGAPDHVAASDWLFTVGAPIPEPAAASTFAAGALVTLGAIRRRRRASA